MQTINRINQTGFDAIIVGGGLAGLVSSIALAKAGKRILLLEKHTYPYHKVCGEYVSNEVLPYLQSLGFDPPAFGAANITNLRISAPNGRNIYTPLDLGAFALSRFVMDDELAKLAVKLGVELQTATRVMDISFEDECFTVTTQQGDTYQAPFVIGSWGKREMLDKKLNRSFMNERTSYMGVKYHIRTDYPIDEIGLDNFKGGYCGIVKIEGDKYNLCNFYRRPQNRDQHTSIQAFQEEIVFQNPVIKNLFQSSDFLFDEPVVINEVSFAPKPPVEHHILMCGDSAGLITPLCGNGMSMAITGAKILTDLMVKSGLIGQSSITTTERILLENAYRDSWAKQFKQRLFWGRTIQKFFGNPLLTDISLRLLHAIPPLERSVISATHGKPLSIQMN